MVTQKHGELKLLMAGSGPDESEYVQRFKELLGENFEFAGVVGGAGKTALMRRCDVFVLPSMFEGLPMALLEGMACGLTPIVTPVGSIPTVVEHGKNGLVVARDSPDELAEAIQTLSVNRQYLQMLGENAQQRIMSICNPDVYVGQLNAIYSYDDSSSIPCS
jgi:glycosyltransferase involved in cell wall biosynthesis